MEGKTKTAEEIISPFVYGNYDNPDDASGLPEGDYIEESKCLEAMEIYAKQERGNAVKEFKEMIIKELDYYGHPSAVQIINDLIKNLK